MRETLYLLGVRVKLSADPVLMRHLRYAFADLFALRPTEHPAADVTVTVTGDPDSDYEVQAALAMLGARVLSVSPLLCIHAGVVESATGLIAVPGESGTGKTTLVAALMRAGFRYISDEVLAVDRATGAVSPLPRPLALGSAVWSMLGLPTTARPKPGYEGLVPPSALGEVGKPGRLQHVLLVDRTDSAWSASLQPAARSTAVRILLGNAFNHFRAPEASFRCVTAAMRSAHAWTGRYRNATDLAATVAGAIPARCD